MRVIVAAAGSTSSYPSSPGRGGGGGALGGGVRSIEGLDKVLELNLDDDLHSNSISEAQECALACCNDLRVSTIQYNTVQYSTIR